LSIIYENKENVIKIKDKNIQNRPPEIGAEKKKAAFYDENEKNMTVTQNRIIENQQFHSKTT
jgi:hypothetical protein